LRLVGEARAGMDGEGVGIDVEEAILEVSSMTLSRWSKS
jgi:methylenetetrahydrofolate dehydrogenase (NAD+)